ncbi:MAG: hypothetical protein II368_02060 [Clostridia bacterium]|jgi:hypothetical protein|nr:hypothetical protein [Clostridia bacterium]MBQ1942414.1 hypothetical protein [Clostridia bacterium]MBQ5802498.1 hypothetical protein [Clostridia bacterium]
MENNEKNGKVVSAQAAEAEKENGAEMTAGKFRDVRSLQQAYESLQAEFTKKCQQVKSLVGELSKKDKEESPLKKAEEEGEEKSKAVAAFLAKREGGGEFLLPLEEKLGGKARVSEREVIEAYVGLLEEARGRERESFFRQSEQLKETAVRDYVKAVAKASGYAPILADAGEVTVLPPRRPASIEDAGKLAVQLFHQTKL